MNNKLNLLEITDFYRDWNYIIFHLNYSYFWFFDEMLIYSNLENNNIKEFYKYWTPLEKINEKWVVVKYSID